MCRDEAGNCCRALEAALSADPKEAKTFFFRSGANGMLFYKSGVYYDGGYIGAPAEPVVFCPFCGVKIQDREDALFEETLYGDEAKAAVRRLIEEMDEVETLLMTR